MKREPKVCHIYIATKTTENKCVFKCILYINNENTPFVQFKRKCIESNKLKSTPLAYYIMTITSYIDRLRDSQYSLNTMDKFIIHINNSNVANDLKTVNRVFVNYNKVTDKQTKSIYEQMLAFIAQKYPYTEFEFTYFNKYEPQNEREKLVASAVK